MHSALTGLAGVLRSGRSAMLLSVGLAISLTATTVFAQPGGGRGGPGGGGGGMRGMMGDMFSAPVAPKEIDLFTQVAGLTTEQKEAAKTLLEGYQAQFRAKSEKIQKEMDKVRQKAQESRDPAAWEGMRATMTTFRAERKEMEDQFFSDFKALLTPEQTERWPLIERAHRRSRTLGRGMISGERVDLLQIMESSKFPVEVQATVIPVLGEYEEALDRELILRNKAYDEVADAFSKATGADGFAKAQEFIQKGREASIRVREVNKRYARQVADMLPADSRPAFEDAVKRASYPEVYRPSLTAQQIAAVEQFTDLDAAQKDSLQALKDNYKRSLSTVNEKLAAAITEREEKWDPRQMGRGGRPGGGGNNGGGRGNGGGNGGNNDDPAGALRRERRDLDDSTAASLKKILTPAQAERLPQEDENAPDDRRRGGNGGGQRRGNTDQQI